MYIHRKGWVFHIIIVSMVYIKLFNNHTYFILSISPHCNAYPSTCLLFTRVVKRESFPFNVWTCLEERIQFRVTVCMLCCVWQTVKGPLQGSQCITYTNIYGILLFHHGNVGVVKRLEKSVWSADSRNCVSCLYVNPLFQWLLERLIAHIYCKPALLL